MPVAKNEAWILKILYKNKVKLLIITLLVGVIVGIFTKLQSNSYSSTAAISIQRPEVPIVGEVPPLNVEALRSLIESTRMKWELFQELKKESVLDEEVEFLQFQQYLSTSVKHDDSRMKKLLPMVKLTVTTDDPELSMTVANRWSDLVLKQTKKIYRSRVDELGIFTSKIFNRVNDSLLESEESYTDTRLNSNLSANKTLLQQNNQLFSVLSTDVSKLKREISTKSALLDNLKEKIAELEIDGIWIGEVIARKSSEGDKDVISASNPLSSRIIRILANQERNKQAMAEFKELNQIEYKKMMIKTKMKQVEIITTEIMKAGTDLSSLEATYNKLKEELSGIKDKVVLYKAIGDDSLWESYLQGTQDKLKELPQLKTEISNTVYQGIRQKIVNLSATTDGLRSKISEGKKARETLKKELSELNREVFLLNNKMEILVSALKRDRDLMAYYEKTYNEDRRKSEIEEKELSKLEVRLIEKEKQLKTVIEKVSLVEKNVFAAESKIARQKREVDNLIRVRGSLAAKVEEIALLKVSMEDISRSGTVLLYQAQADPIKVGPKRTRTVLIAMLLTFIVSGLFLIAGAVIREG